MTGRIGDVVTDPALARCSGCGKSTLECEMQMDRESTFCCGGSTGCHHVHTLHTLKLYGMLTR